MKEKGRQMFSHIHAPASCSLHCMSKANRATEVSYRCSVSIQGRCMHDTLSMQASTLFQAESSDAATIASAISSLHVSRTEYDRGKVRGFRMNGPPTSLPCSFRDNDLGLAKKICSRHYWLTSLILISCGLSVPVH